MFLSLKLVSNIFKSQRVSWTKDYKALVVRDIFSRRSEVQTETRAELGFYPPKHSTAELVRKRIFQNHHCKTQSLFAPHPTSKSPLHAVILFLFYEAPSWEFSTQLRDFVSKTKKFSQSCVSVGVWLGQKMGKWGQWRILLISWLETTKDLLPMFLLQQILCNRSYNWAYINRSNKYIRIYSNVSMYNMGSQV